MRMVTLIGDGIQLPKIDNPKSEQIDKWHGVYVKKLTELFYSNAEKFGFKPELQVY